MKFSKTVVLSFFSLNSINALVRHDGKFQILNNGSDCLTLQTGQSSYLATDPVSQVQSFYPDAQYQPCDATNERQWFELNSDSQLEADSLCLTPLPIDASSHANLLACDTWTSFTGVGSYLFSIACDPTNTAQTFTQIAADPSTGLNDIYQSGCAHQLFLGEAGVRALLTGDSNTFPTAIIISDVQTTPDLVVDLDSQIGGNTILDSLLTGVELNAVLDHGCYCSRYDLAYTDSATLSPIPIDELDRICKKWARTRRCNHITGGSCFGNHMNGNYTIAQSVSATGSVQFQCNNNDSCLDDSCVIDMTFGLQILAYLEANPSFVAQQTATVDCLANVGPGGQVLERVCSGTAPDLEFQVVII